jgi:glutathione S-transferase
MNTPSHDFVTVEMRGLKAALVARAQAQRVSVSVLVRAAVERELGFVDPSAASEVATRAAASAGPIVKLSIRLTRGEAEQLDAGARRAGLSRGAFLAGLLANVPSLTGDSASHVDCLVALTSSSAELSTLSRNIYRLTALLRQGEVGPAQQYRRLLDTLGDDVRAHLSLAASVLADLRPARPSAGRGESRRPAAS